MRRDFDMMAPGASPFQPRLLPGERILWQGRPERGLYLRGMDYFKIAYGFIFAFLGVKMLLNVVNMPVDSDVMTLIGVLFVVAGLLPPFGRLFIEAWLRRRLSYAVTDKRILVDRAGPFGRFASLNLHAMPAINLSGSAAIGSLRFGEPVSFFQKRFMYLSSAMPALDPVPQFLNIAEPDKVLALITDAAHGKG